MKQREFWVSGINFDEYLLKDDHVVTAFITKSHISCKPESIHIREVSPEIDAAIQKMVEVLEAYSILDKTNIFQIRDKTEATKDQEMALIIAGELQKSLAPPAKEALEAWRKANEN